MDLKEAIINEFNLLVDNLQNSFIEKLKQRLAQTDLSPDLSNHDDLPLKRSEASKVSKPRKTSKLPEDYKESKEPHSTLNDQSSLKSKESKIKKLRKNSEETDQDHVQPAKKPSETQFEPKPEKPKTEEKPETKTETKHDTKDSSLNKDKKDPRDQIEMKEEKYSKALKEDQRFPDLPTVPKKSEESKKQHEPKPYIQESSKSEDLKRTVDPEKVQKWNSFNEKIISAHRKSDDSSLYKILLSFSQEINDKITEGEVGLIDVTLNYLKDILPTSHKNTKPLIQSIISRCKSKLPRANHINKHLESLGVKLN